MPIPLSFRRWMSENVLAVTDTPELDVSRAQARPAGLPADEMADT